MGNNPSGSNEDSYKTKSKEEFLSGAYESLEPDSVFCRRVFTLSILYRRMDIVELLIKSRKITEFWHDRSMDAWTEYSFTEWIHDSTSWDTTDSFFMDDNNRDLTKTERNFSDIGPFVASLIGKEPIFLEIYQMIRRVSPLGDEMDSISFYNNCLFRSFSSYFRLYKRCHSDGVVLNRMISYLSQCMSDKSPLVLAILEECKRFEPGWYGVFVNCLVDNFDNDPSRILSCINIARVLSSLEYHLQKDGRKLVKTLLACSDSDPNSRDTIGNTILHNAINHSHNGLFIALMNNPKTNPNLLDNRFQSSLVIAYNRSNYDAMVSLLLDNRVILSDRVLTESVIERAKGHINHSHLVTACRNKRMHLVEILMDKGNLVSSIMKNKDDTLNQLMSCGCMEAIEMLMSRYLSHGCTNVSKTLDLMFRQAVELKNSRVIELVIKYFCEYRQDMSNSFKTLLSNNEIDSCSLFDIISLIPESLLSASWKGIKSDPFATPFIKRMREERLDMSNIPTIKSIRKMIISFGTDCFCDDKRPFWDGTQFLPALKKQAHNGSFNVFKPLLELIQPRMAIAVDCKVVVNACEVMYPGIVQSLIDYYIYDGSLPNYETLSECMAIVLLLGSSDKGYCPLSLDCVKKVGNYLKLSKGHSNFPGNVLDVLDLLIECSSVANVANVCYVFHCYIVRYIIYMARTKIQPFLSMSTNERMKPHILHELDSIVQLDEEPSLVLATDLDLPERGLSHLYNDTQTCDLSIAVHDTHGNKVIKIGVHRCVLEGSMTKLFEISERSSPFPFEMISVIKYCYGHGEKSEHQSTLRIIELCLMYGIISLDDQIVDSLDINTDTICHLADLLEDHIEILGHKAIVNGGWINLIKRIEKFITPNTLDILDKYNQLESKKIVKLSGLLIEGK